MDLPIWIMLAAVLLVAAQASPADQGPQVFSEGTPTPQKKHKREPKYEMKEVILYLTPSQIRAFEASQGLIQPQQGSQPDLSSPLKEQIDEQIKNALNTQGQKLQRQKENNSETNRKQRLQLQEAIQNKPSAAKEQQQNLAPENSAPQYPKFDLQKREKFVQLPPFQFQLAPTASPQLELPGIRNGAQLEQQLIPVAEPQFEQRLVPTRLPQLEPQLNLEALPQVGQLNLNSDKKQLNPQSYAYLYFYPKGKPREAENLELFYPREQDNRQQQLVQPQNFPILHPNFELIPYEYGLQNKLEAQQILQAQLNEHHLESHRLKEHRLEPQQLEDIDIQQLLAQKQLEPEYLQTRPQPAQAQEQESHQFAPELKAQQSNAPRFDFEQLEAITRQQIKEVEEARKLKAKLEAEEKEAHRLDAQLKEEERKAEQMKNEQEELEYLKTLVELEPKRTKMHSILKPLFQGYNIAQSLEQQKASFPHQNIFLETGFKPLQYAPKYNNEKYAKEVEKMLQRNLLEKQKALAKAAAIANEPPEIIHSEKEIIKRRPIELVKHVTVKVPTPVFVPVPEPFEVKVPQPYPVPLETVRPVPIPIVKMEKVEVPKPVPIEIEKHIPYPVTKNVYIKVDKPYFVEQIVPVEVKKEIPVEIPVRKPQKLSIIRHVWES